MSVLICNIFIAEDFTLNLKSTYWVAVVKSSKIITGNSSKILSVSSVYPKMNDLPAVKTGVGYLSSYSVEFTIYLEGCSKGNNSPSLYVVTTVSQLISSGFFFCS